MLAARANRKMAPFGVLYIDGNAIKVDFLSAVTAMFSKQLCQKGENAETYLQYVALSFRRLSCIDRSNKRLAARQLG